MTVVLPMASVVSGAARCGLCVSANQFNTSTGQFPTTVTITNGGFLPLDGVYASVNLVSSSGASICDFAFGPVDLQPGGSVPLNICSPSGAAALGSASFTAKVDAKANLAGLIPISVSAQFTVSPGSATGA